MTHADDRLDGARAIAAYLNRKPRWVWQARERGWDVPIRKRDGIGIYAFKSELDAWLRAPETLSPKDPKMAAPARSPAPRSLGPPSNQVRYQAATEALQAALRDLKANEAARRVADRRCDKEP